MRELLPELIAALDARRPCVWCVVVETRGSTPQKAGAAMLVYDDGRQVGTLGGGCVEAEVKRQALHGLHAEQGPAAHTFLLDDDFGWDDGLICGGRMTVVAHPVLDRSDEPAQQYFRQLHALNQSAAGFIEAIVADQQANLPIGDRYLFDLSGQPLCHLGNRPEWNAVSAILHQYGPLGRRPKPATRGGIAFLPLLPRITVLLVGGGHVAQAVARLAADVDFDIWVLDDRERYANRERFPAANRVFVGDIGPTLQGLVPELTPAHYALVVTRGHNHDEEALFHLSGSACGFVGMIGSQRKNRLIFDDLLGRGISPELLAKVHAPLGIPIGSQTVPEIAVSIVAELVRWRNLGPDAKP